MRKATDDATFLREFPLLGAAGFARKYGVSERNVHSRRRRLEGLLEATLVPPPRGNSMLVTHDRVEVKLEVEDGVVLVCGDQHFHPGNIPVMHRALCYLAKKLKPYAIIWNGDAFDGSTISRFPSIGWENKPTVKQELEEVGNRSTEVIQAAPGAKRVWCAGNHDLRLETRIAANLPEYRGVKGVHLKDHFPEWTPAWFVTVNSGLPSHTEIRHRERGGVHAGYLNTLHSGVNIVTGHDHVAEVRRYVDRRGPRYGVRHGMTADSSRDAPFVNYLEGRTPSWTAALAVLSYRKGELLQPELALRRDEESFEFRGEILKV